MLRKTAIALCLLFVTLTSFAQSINELPEKRFVFGFNAGLNYSNIVSDESPLPNNGEISNALGYKLGVLMEYVISPNVIIAPKAELSFNNGTIDFPDAGNTPISYEVLPVSLDVMAHVILKKAGHNFTPYALIGPNFRMPLQKSTNSAKFGSSPDLAIDFGLGLDKAFTKFRFAPEIRYSLGLLNVNETPLLQSASLHSLSLTLNFKK